MVGLARAPRRQTNLRLDADHRLLLNMIRRHLEVPHDSDAGASAIRLQAEQIAAAMAAEGRAGPLLALLGQLTEAVRNYQADPPPAEPYRYDQERRQVLRWDPRRGDYVPIHLAHPTL